MRGKVIIIDDDAIFLQALCTYLKGRGFEVTGYQTWDMSIIKSLKNTDVAILDVNLPEISGYDILSFIRTKHLSTKVFMITGDDSLPKRLRSFALGANDYLKKPVYPAEVAARVDRYCSQLYSTVFVDKDIEKISSMLTKQELKIFQTLLNCQGNIVRLLYTGEEKSVYTVISRLKRKLINTRYSIVSSYGQGWRLIKR